MATTAHEVALGVSVDSRAAEDALLRLSTSLTALGSAFNGRVLGQIQQFNSAVLSAVPSVNALSAAVTRLSVPLAAVTTAASTANRALSGINVAPMVTQASQLNVAMTGLVGSVSGLANAAIRLSAPLSTLATSLAAVNASSASLNIAAVGTQLQAFASAINAVDATRLARQIGVISGALDRGSTSIAAYPGMVASMARSFQRMGALDIGNIFRQQIVGVTGLNSALTTALGPIQNYGTALRTIAGASRTLMTASSSIGALSAQAAGIQLLSNAIALNIVNLQRYATAMSTVAAATSSIGRSSASTGRLVTSMAAMAASAPTVAGAFISMTASIGPFADVLRAAATSAQRLYTRLVQLSAISGSLSTAIGSSRSSMGLFAGILGVAAGSIASQVGLLGRLASSYNSAGSAARSTNSAVSSSNGIFSAFTSVVSSLGRELSIMAAGYIGFQAIKETGKNILKTGADFDNAMGMVRAVSRNTSDYTTEAFMAMEREAFRMGRTTTYSATQAAAALKELTQGGLTTNQAIESLSDTMTLAETEAMSMADASRIVTSMMAQFQASSAELTDYVDKLAKTSAVSKTSIEQLKFAMNYVGTAARSANQPFAEVVSAIGALSTAGVESSQAGTTLRDMLTDLTDTTSYASRKLKGLGMDMSLIDPRANKLSEIIGTLRARGIDAADAMGIFGVRGGLAAGSLITVYRQYMDVLNSVQNQSKGTAAIMQQDVTDNLRKDFDRLAASWDYLVNRIFKSGFGNLMRNIVKQAKDLTIQVADIVDTLKNAKEFGDLSEIIDLSLTVAFGTASNYLMGALTTVMQIAGDLLINRVKVLAQVGFWSSIFDILKSAGAVLAGGVKLAAANLLDANRDFAAGIIQSVMYAGDLFINKMKEAKEVIMGDARFTGARYSVANARKEYEGFVERKSKEVKEARDQLLFTPAGSKDEPRARKRLDYVTDELMVGSDSRRKNLESAMERLKSAREAAGYTTEEQRPFADYKEAAMSAVPDISTAYKEGAAEDFKTASQNLPGAVMAAAGMLTKGILQPVIEGVKAFKPINVTDTTKQRERLDVLLKENAPTPPSAPTKTFVPVTTGKVSTGVGPIAMESKTSETLRQVVGSMKEIGAGTWVSKFGTTMSPLERATNLNTAATNNLTAAITGQKRDGTDLKENTRGVTRKDAIDKKIESEIQTDIETWARTGKRPERLRKRQEATTAKQTEIDAERQMQQEKIENAKRAKEEEIAADQQRNADINAQAVQRQQKERITATLVTEMKLGNPVTWALKKGISPNLDKDGKPIAQPNVRLGLPTDIMFGSGGGDFGASTTLYDILPQIRRGALSRGTRSDRTTTPTDLTTYEIKKLQTVMPKDEGYKQRVLDSDPLSTAPFTMQSGLSYDQEGLNYQLGLLYPDANYTIDERRKKQLLNSSPLENMEFSPLSTLPISNSFSQTSTPQISDNGDKNGEQQLAELTNMSSLLDAINSNIIKGNAKESQRLTIKIT